MSAKSSSLHARLQSVVDTWSSTQASGFLSEAAPFPLPSQGPLHKLLMTTMCLVTEDETVETQTATDAVTTGAALVIAKIVNWLQQQPDQFLMCQSSMNMTTWRVLTQFIQWTVSEHLSPFRETSYELLTQLVASGEIPEQMLAQNLCLAMLAALHTCVLI
jgi:hypothetical protein